MWVSHNNMAMVSSPGQSAPSTLLSFTAENTRSYRDEVHLSLLATRLSAEGVPRSVVPTGMTRPVRVLPAVGIFGANASGKTTILRAMEDMRRLVATSFRHGSRDTRVARSPFLLDPASAERPTRFEVDLLLEGVRWVYRFAVDDRRVLEESAYYWPRGRRSLVFRRREAELVFGSPFGAKDRTIEDLLRGNALLLSVAGATENRVLAALFDWFNSNLLLMESDNRVPRAFMTADMASKQDQRKRILQILQAADFGITSLTVSPLDDEDAEQLRRVFSLIRQVDGDPDLPDPLETDVVSFRQLGLTHSGAEDDVTLGPEDESQGTLVWVSLIGPMLQALDDGTVVLVDEIDVSLHSDLVRLFVEMFQDPQTNHNGAQLIFNSHDGALLEGVGAWSLGRDQIWFTEKYANGATKLYSLDDFGPRRDDDIRGRYFRGRYGAIPVIGDASLRNALAPSGE
ncbi:MAG: ATP-binding protein [Acidimicrobiia bacterium]|nr:ATP-binding protein [Acidimicrobiia bacterium]